MLDPDLPFEFENGVPVELDRERTSRSANARAIYFHVPEGTEYMHNGGKQAITSSYWYYRDTGCFGTSENLQKKYLRIQNVQAPAEPEDWS